jgi:hypothetical protein
MVSRQDPPWRCHGDGTESRWGSRRVSDLANRFRRFVPDQFEPHQFPSQERQWESVRTIAGWPEVTSESR